MRYLSRLVFINSATIPFSEVRVDGNVHLIGTQGVGKSTLLRAILFFYNADTLKLGISRQKKSYPEYYFPYQNSYVIYEVMRETGPYCVLTFKSQGKVCYRFIDTGFDKKYFISEQGQAFQKWEDSRLVLDADNIYYSRKVDNYGEFRDILYGNSESGKKEFVRYALLQSKQYQNIPRTIQNVFLNSKLEAEFIKQTIIMSLNEEELFIDLESYAHHLKDFEGQVSDINQYKLPAVRQLAEKILKYHLGVRHLQRDKGRIILNLVWAGADVNRKLPRLQEKASKAATEKEILKNKRETAETRLRNKLEKLKGDISVLDNDLKKAKEKTDFYTKLDIHKILERVSLRKDVEERVKALDRELILLNTKFGALTQKYDTLLLALENERGTYVQQKGNEKVELRSSLMDEISLFRKSLSNSLKDIRESNQSAELEAAEQVKLQTQLFNDYRIKKEGIRHQRFLEEELTETQKEISELQQSVQRAVQQAESCKSKQQTLEKQWELDSAKVDQDYHLSLERNKARADHLNGQLKAISSRLAGYSDALYGWLNENKEGWEDNIGKVIAEDVLFNKELLPQIIGDTNSLYGIEIRLGELPVQVKSLADYQKEQKELESKIEICNQELVKLGVKQSGEHDRLKKKYQPQLKHCKEEYQEQLYIAERDSNQLKIKQILQKDLKMKAGEEKQKAISEIDNLIDAANESVLQANKELQLIKDTVDKQIKAKEKEIEKKIASIESEGKSKLQKIDDDIREFDAEIEKRKMKLLEERDKELEGKGADVNRIQETEKEIGDWRRELKFIEDNWDLVVEYKKDKRELIDKADDFKSKKLLLEQQYDTEDQKYKNQQAIFDRDISAVEQQLKDLEKQMEQLNEDQDAFHAFMHTHIWKDIDDTFKQEKDAYRTDKRCKTLIEEANYCDRDILQRWDQLKDAANRFLGHFSAHNIFNFRTALSLNDEYAQFAEELNEFVDNSKIEEYEKRVNDRFASIILTIGKETSMLMSKGGEIQKVITEINKDFDSKNFVTAIQKIELKIDESSNSVVRLLLQIKQYNDAHSYDLGGVNLFSSVDQDAKNRRATDLLKQLSKAMVDYKKETIALSDTFELKFRIEENHNDSGWVEKLSNVGSEGTDVLVKAMINIMLLNVFKEGASRKFKDFRLHCMMDEIGKLHPVNVKGILQFANDRNINLINGSPTETNAFDYKHIYRLEKDAQRNTRIKRIITNNSIT